MAIAPVRMSFENGGRLPNDRNGHSLQTKNEEDFEGPAVGMAPPVISGISAHSGGGSSRSLYRQCDRDQREECCSSLHRDAPSLCRRPTIAPEQRSGTRDQLEFNS